MTKSVVINKMGGKIFGFSVPADGATAKTFCDNHLEGEYKVFEAENTQGNEVEASVIKVTVTGKNADQNADQIKTTFSLLCKSWHKRERD